MSRNSRQGENLRSAIAAVAARFIADGTARDFHSAKRKAASQLGVEGTRHLPDNAQLQAAVADHQALFEGERQGSRLRELRVAALAAMQALSEFAPRLAGPVLAGTACGHSTVGLHLFSEEVEAVTRFLLGRGIGFDLSHKAFRFAAGSTSVEMPMFEVSMSGTEFELVVFRCRGPHRHPLSAVDGKLMERADIKSLRELLASEQTYGSPRLRRHRAMGC